MFLFTCCVRPCIGMLDDARHVSLLEMINAFVCMNPKDAKQEWLLVKTIMWVS